MSISQKGVGVAINVALASIKKEATTAWKEHCKALTVTGYVVGSLVALKTVFLTFAIGRQIALNANFRNLEKDMVHLFVHHRWSHGPNYFPHCLKVETFLRLAKIPYTIHFTSNASISPTGRIPFVVHNGTILGDSGLIIDYLKKEFKVSMDDQLTQEEHAIGLLMRRMVETSLNYGLQRTTMVDRPELMQEMFSKEYLLEPAIANLLVRRMRSKLIEVLETVGYGKLEKEYYKHEFLREVESLETLLSHWDFLLGDTPTSYDCSIYGCLQIACEMGPHGPALIHLNESKTLRKYVNRMSLAAFPDINELLTINESQKYIPVE